MKPITKRQPSTAVQAIRMPSWEAGACGGWFCGVFAVFSLSMVFRSFRRSFFRKFRRWFQGKCPCTLCVSQICRIIAQTGFCLHLFVHKVLIFYNFYRQIPQKISPCLLEPVDSSLRKYPCLLKACQQLPLKIPLAFWKPLSYNNGACFCSSVG